MHGEDRDIFERLYAVRLDRLRALPECRELLARWDKFTVCWTFVATAAKARCRKLDDDALLAELGHGRGRATTISPCCDTLRPVGKTRVAEEIANPRPARILTASSRSFAQVQQELT